MAEMNPPTVVYLAINRRNVADTHAFSTNEGRRLWLKKVSAKIYYVTDRVIRPLTPEAP